MKFINIIAKFNSFLYMPTWYYFVSGLFISKVNVFYGCFIHSIQLDTTIS